MCPLFLFGAFQVKWRGHEAPCLAGSCDDLRHPQALSRLTLSEPPCIFRLHFARQQDENILGLRAGAQD